MWESSSLCSINGRKAQAFHSLFYTSLLSKAKGKGLRFVMAVLSLQNKTKQNETQPQSLRELLVEQFLISLWFAEVWPGGSWESLSASISLDRKANTRHLIYLQVPFFCPSNFISELSLCLSRSEVIPFFLSSPSIFPRSFYFFQFTKHKIIYKTLIQSSFAPCIWPL